VAGRFSGRNAKAEKRQAGEERDAREACGGASGEAKNPSPVSGAGSPISAICSPNGSTVADDCWGVVAGILNVDEIEMSLARKDIVACFVRRSIVRRISVRLISVRRTSVRRTSRCANMYSNLRQRLRTEAGKRNWRPLENPGRLAVHWRAGRRGPSGPTVCAPAV
jgi:hypothetical protein